MHIAHVVFVPQIYAVENFREFNFVVGSTNKNILTPNFFPILRYCLYTTGIIISLPLCSNQVDMCRKYNAKIIQCGKDIGEAKEHATKKAEEDGLQYVNG